MFSNIGRKIKGLAKFVCWFGIIGCVIGGLIMISQGNSLNSHYYRNGDNAGSSLITCGFLVLILGSICSWLGSLTLYGFGELIDRAISIDNKMKYKSIIDVQQTDKANTHHAAMDFIQLATPDSSTAVEEQNRVNSVDSFLNEIQSAETVVDIWVIWRKYKLDIKYYNVEDYIRKYKDQEQLHGNIDNIAEIKDTIRSLMSN